MRRNPTYPLPDSFPATEPGLLTRDEFLSARNKDEKHHEADAYQTSVSTLNPDRDHQVGRSEDRRKRAILVYQIGDSLIFRDAESSDVIGVTLGAVLYRDRFRDVPPWYRGLRGGEIVNLAFAAEHQVKYPEQYAVRAYNTVGRNLVDHPHLIQRVKLGGEMFEVRSAEPPRPNKLDTIVFLNRDGLIVAEGSNEWGASLLRVAEEYQGKGLGRSLAAFWYEFNPQSVSGGFTRSGKANAIATWDDRVREFLSRGWYSALVRRGDMTTDRVREITAGLSTKRRRSTRLPEYTAPEPEEDLRVYVDDSGVSFVLYDARFLGDPDEKYIRGFGFIRDFSGGSYFYRIEHDKGNGQLTTAIGLQLARDLGDPIFVETIPGDLLEWEGVPHAEYKDGFVSLTQDLIPLKQLARTERRERAKVDEYDQLKNQLLELAESKEWGR